MIASTYRSFLGKYSQVLAEILRVLERETEVIKNKDVDVRYTEVLKEYPILRTGNSVHQLAGHIRSVR